MTPAHRWPARLICNDTPTAERGEICATIWPTRHLHSPMRWFDELYVWAEGFEPTRAQWSRIQLLGLQRALVALTREQAETMAVTLSYSTAQNYAEQVDELLQAHALVAHRLVVLLRGSIGPGHLQYRIRAFVDYLRAQQIVVGMRVTTPRLAMELDAFGLVRPEFAKILAPAAAPVSAWESLVLEARFSGISERWLIVAGLQTAAQIRRALQCGIGFGQGTAVRPAHAPSGLRRDPGASRWEAALPVE
jgi:hypothetical protein